LNILVYSEQANLVPKKLLRGGKFGRFEDVLTFSELGLAHKEEVFEILAAVSSHLYGLSKFLAFLELSVGAFLVSFGGLC
jgi:hypothetical protein